MSMSEWSKTSMSEWSKTYKFKPKIRRNPAKIHILKF